MCSMWTRLGAEAEEAEAVEAKELAQEASCERKSKHWKGGKEEEITRPRDKKVAGSSHRNWVLCPVLYLKYNLIVSAQLTVASLMVITRSNWFSWIQEIFVREENPHRKEI